MAISKVFMILITIFLGLCYFYQRPIEIYWQQTHHTDIPLLKLKKTVVHQKLDWLASGIKITNMLSDKFNYYENILLRWNRNMISHSNLLLPHTNGKSSPKTIIATENHNLAQQQLETEIVPVSATNTNDIFPNTNSDDQQASQSIEPLNTIEVITESLQSETVTETKLRTIFIQESDKLFFVGDSLMQGVAPHIKRSLYKKYKIEGIDLSKQSTGLSYPSAFDWPQTVEKTLDADPMIKVMVIFLGPNDPWSFPIKGRKNYIKFKTVEWEEIYRSRIVRILAAAEKHQVQVIWLGAPCMKKVKLHHDMLYLNTLYQSEVTKFGARYIPTSELLGCSDEKYMNFITTSRGNVKVRINDGIHFSRAGQRIIAERIISELAIQPKVKEDKDE
jgi:hypothetical protein